MIRTQIFRALHAEGAKRGLGHEEIREIARDRFGISSMGELDIDQVRALYRQVAGREFRSKHPGIRDRRRRRAAGTAGRHKGQGRSGKVVHLVRPEDVELLCQLACRRLGWSEKTLKVFIRRQLRGRDSDTYDGGSERGFVAGETDGERKGEAKMITFALWAIGGFVGCLVSFLGGMSWQRRIFHNSGVYNGSDVQIAWKEGYDRAWLVAKTSYEGRGLKPAIGFEGDGRTGDARKLDQYVGGRPIAWRH